MIPQQAIDEVRAGVMGQLRRRRAIKRTAVATAVMLLTSIALFQTKQAPKFEPIAKVEHKTEAAPKQVASTRQWGGPPGLRLAPRPAPPRAPRMPPKTETAEARRPQYIKVYTENPDVVFLLLTSDEGGI